MLTIFTKKLHHTCLKGSWISLRMVTESYHKCKMQYSLFLSSHSVYQISWIFPIYLTYFTPYYLTGNQELNLHSILPPFTYWTQKKSFSWTYTSAHQEFWYSFNGYLILLSKPSFISDYQSYSGKKYVTL